MKHLTILIGLLTILSAGALSGQRESTYKKGDKDVGLNLSSFIGQFVPLNNGNIPLGAATYSYKRWGNKNAFRFSFGANLFQSDDFFSDFVLDFYLGLGWERVKFKSGKWEFHNGAEVAMFIGTVDNLVEEAEDSGISLAYVPFFEFQYHFNDFIYASTTARMAFGFNMVDIVPIIEVVPPLGLFLYVKIRSTDIVNQGKSLLFY